MKWGEVEDGDKVWVDDFKIIIMVVGHREATKTLK